MQQPESSETMEQSSPDASSINLRHAFSEAVRLNPNSIKAGPSFTLFPLPFSHDSIQRLCSGQVISDSLIDFFDVDSRSKALGDMLPSVECSLMLL